MKKQDLKEGTIFRRRSNQNRIYTIIGSPAGHLVYETATDASVYFQGYIKPTGSNKGFTLIQLILGKPVGAFFLFKDFEVITTNNQ